MIAPVIDISHDNDETSLARISAIQASLTAVSVRNNGTGCVMLDSYSLYDVDDQQMLDFIVHRAQRRVNRFVFNDVWQMKETAVIVITATAVVIYCATWGKLKR